MRKLPIVIAIAAGLAILAAGCQGSYVRTQPSFGEVTGGEGSWTILGKPYLGDVTVRVGDRNVRLFEVYDDATILVFTNEACSGANAHILKASAWLDPNVALIEVSNDPTACRARQECIGERPNGVGNIVSLCDSGDVLRSLYRTSAADAVLVLDDEGSVRFAGTTRDFDYLRLAAEDLARQDRADRQDRLRGQR
jgi:hypothetical protein